MTHLRLALIAVLSAFVAMSASTLATAELRHVAAFNFRDAEFMREDDANRSVQEFLAARLPNGLPLSEARSRLTQALMTCSARGRAEAILSCSYSIPTHADGGIIGDDTWTVYVPYSPDRRVVSTRYEHRLTRTNG